MKRGTIMKIRVLVSALLITTSFTASSIASRINEEQKEPPKEVTKQEQIKPKKGGFGVFGFKSKKQLEEEDLKMQQEKSDKMAEFEKMNTAGQIKIFKDLLEDFKIGLEKNPEFLDKKANREKKEINTDIARKTMVQLANLDRLTHEQLELFKLVVAFANEYGNTEFSYMPKVIIRVKQLLPKYELRTGVSNYGKVENTEEAYVKNYGTVLKLTPEESEKIAHNPPKITD